MADIHDFTRRIFRDHIYGVEESISNTASVATLRQVFKLFIISLICHLHSLLTREHSSIHLKIILSYSGAEIMMGFEGQLGALDVWLNDTYTKEFNPTLPFSRIFQQTKTREELYLVLRPLSPLFPRGKCQHHPKRA